LIPRRTSDDSDAKSLSRFGYAQELLRAMGGFSSFALSFSIISVLTGIVTTYDVAIQNGGPAGLGIGWPVVCAGTFLVALAMAELASAFPTAGAMYHWAAILGGPGLGWFTSMMNLVGQLAIVAAIDLGCAEQTGAAIGLPATCIVPTFALILATQGVINFVSVRLVAWLNDFSAAVHVVGVVVLVLLLAGVGHARPFAFAMQTGFTTRADGNYALGFASSLLLGMWTFTGFDASAHVSEETHDPQRRAPWGIVSAVGISAVAGYALVVAITLAIRDLAATASDAHPALFVLRAALGEAWGRAAMGLAIVAMWFCGLSAITSTSRTLYAFARDSSLPGAKALASVSVRLKTPHVAIVASAGVALALGIASSQLTENQFLAVASLATTALYVSYALPIALGAVARHRGKWHRRGPWNLGRASAPIAWGAVAWSIAVLGAFGLPHEGAYLKLLAGVAAALAGIYVVFERGRFTGPRVHLDVAERGAPTGDSATDPAGQPSAR
jgi:amino acid transporter